MRKLFKDLLTKHFDSPATGGLTEHDYQLATAVLLIEMARADDEVTRDELDTIKNAIQRTFDLDGRKTTALMDVAENEADTAISLHDYTSELNRFLDKSQKKHLVELLWQVAFSDGAVDRYEDHFVRKVSDLLYLKHSEFVQAKHKMQRQADETNTD